ncbi:MAG: AAA family ATPase, partial [Solirubrobacteraceae bacterium]
MEREVELERVGRVFDRVGAGVGAVVVVQGPAGIGKSELLAAVRAAAVARGFGVLWCFASDGRRSSLVLPREPDQWFASESMTQIRVLISPHLRGFGLDQEGSLMTEPGDSAGSNGG